MEECIAQQAKIIEEIDELMKYPLSLPPKKTQELQKVYAPPKEIPVPLTFPPPQTPTDSLRKASESVFKSEKKGFVRLGPNVKTSQDIYKQYMVLRLISNRSSLNHANPIPNFDSPSEALENKTMVSGASGSSKKQITKEGKAAEAFWLSSDVVSECDAIIDQLPMKEVSENAFMKERLHEEVASLIRRHDDLIKIWKGETKRGSIRQKENESVMEFINGTRFHLKEIILEALSHERIIISQLSKDLLEYFEKNQIKIVADGEAAKKMESKRILHWEAEKKKKEIDAEIGTRVLELYGSDNLPELYKVKNLQYDCDEKTRQKQKTNIKQVITTAKTVIENEFSKRKTSHSSLSPSLNFPPQKKIPQTTPVSPRNLSPLPENDRSTETAGILGRSDQTKGQIKRPTIITSPLYTGKGKILSHKAKTAPVSKVPSCNDFSESFSESPDKNQNANQNQSQNHNSNQNPVQSKEQAADSFWFREDPLRAEREGNPVSPLRQLAALPNSLKFKPPEAPEIQFPFTLSPQNPFSPDYRSPEISFDEEDFDEPETNSPFLTPKRQKTQRSQKGQPQNQKNQKNPKDPKNPKANDQLSWKLGIMNAVANYNTIGSKEAMQYLKEHAGEMTTDDSGTTGHQKLEEIWGKLGLSTMQKIEMLVKYSASADESEKLGAALNYWEAALAIFERYERVYVSAKDFLKMEYRHGLESTYENIEKELEFVENSLLAAAENLKATFSDELIVKRRKCSDLILGRRQRLEMLKRKVDYPSDEQK